MRAADQALRDCRDAETVAAQAAAAASAHLTAARQHVDAAARRPRRRPADEATIRAQLPRARRPRRRRPDRAERRWPQRARRTATAQRAADGETATEAALRSALGRTRDPLVALGAPAVDQLDILQGWQLLADWSGGAQKYRRTASFRRRDRGGRRRARADDRRARPARGRGRADDSYTAENQATGSPGTRRRRPRRPGGAVGAADGGAARRPERGRGRRPSWPGSTCCRPLPLRRTWCCAGPDSRAAKRPTPRRRSTRSYAAAWQSLRTARDGFVAPRRPGAARWVGRSGLVRR